MPSTFRIRILHGPHWSLPIKVEEHMGLYRVSACGTITAAMRKVVQAKIAELGKSNGDDCWFVPKEKLEAVSDWTPWPTYPDDCISWVSYTGRCALTQQPKGMETFFEEFVRAGFASSVPKAQLLYGAWCQLILEHLIVQKKPVDLGFAKLEAMPLRSDWIATMRQTQSMRPRDYRNPRKSIRHVLRNGRLLAFDALNNVVLWRVELKHKMAWWRGAIKAEIARRNALGKLRYMINAATLLKDKQESVYELFAAYISQARRAALKIPYRVGLCFKHSSKKHRIKPTIRPVAQKLVRVIKSNWRPARRDGEKGVEGTVAGANADVLPLPSVQPGVPDVRNSLEKPADPQDGTEG